MSAEAWGNGGDKRKPLSHVFHLLSQPVTALQCSLEFALNSFDDPPQCRTWIEAALENCERLRCRLSLAREIAEAAEPIDAGDTSELRSVLEEALTTVEALFATPHGRPELLCDAVEICGEHSRLLRAFLHILQNLSCADTAAREDAPEIRVEHNAEVIEVRFSHFLLREGSSKDQIASQLEVAKEIFESLGGGLVFFCYAGNDAFVRVFLLKPQAQLNLYGDGACKKPATNAIDRAAALPQVS